MEKPGTDQNDWENADEWDDWGDAEDNEIQDFETQKNNVSTVEIEAKAKQMCPENEVQSSREDTKSTSWASMLRPFGGVVSTITTSVSQGINQVIGVPDPEDLARMNATEAAKAKESKREVGDVPKYLELQKEKEATASTAPIFGMDLVSGVTTLGSKVLNTGLDTLEGIGKKTMTMLQENDPLLINKRKLLGLDADKPNLSAVLQEAKKDADQLEHTLKQLRIEKSKTALRFESLFENNCGLMHLEALEILSKESELKLKKLLDAISGQALLDLRETVNEVKELMQLEDLEGESDGNFAASELLDLLTTAIEDADLNVNFDDIVNIWTDILVWFENANVNNEVTAEEVFAKAITLQAETCALGMNKLHKIAEMLLVKEHHSTASEVDGIVQLCKQFNMLLNGLTNRFANVLTHTVDGKQLTNILFSEMLLATQQIEKAFKLFLPILQIGAV